MSKRILIIVAVCIAALIGSQALRAGQSKQNCENVKSLRDAMTNVIVLADELTPPSPKSDEFYADARAELGKVTC